MEFSHWGQKVAQITLNAVFPPRCAGCGYFSEKVFCGKCQNTLRPLLAPWCRVCGTPFDPGALAADLCAACRPNRYNLPKPFAAARSAYFYEGPLRQAVHALKYRGKTVHAPPLASLMAMALGQDKDWDGTRWQIVVPVPLHPWRRWRRGFNQSELLANGLARELSLPVSDALQRVRFTQPQVGLTRDERELNVKGSFRVSEECGPLIAHKNIVLVDDVLTTGATCAEATLALKAAGAGEVMVVTLARDS